MLHIVTDSTSDLTLDEAAALGVTVVPLTVRFGDDEFSDGVDILPDAFYRRLQEGGALPSTSQPTPERFEQSYRRLLAGPDDRVLSIHIAQRFSGTVQSATIAAGELSGRVAVVDSGSVSLGLQFLVRAALRDRTAGESADAIVAATEARRERLRIYVMLDTLTYLAKGGRIGPARAFLGSVLKVKPILRVVDGQTHPETRVRNAQQGVARLLELIAAEGALEAVGTMHSSAPDLLDRVRAGLAERYAELEVIGGQLGPVVGTYAGPGAIGVACLRAG